MALGKGKYVQVEIPMSLNLPDAERMVQAATRSGRICMVTHTRCFSSPHREIRKRVQEGTFHLHHMVVGDDVTCIIPYEPRSRLRAAFFFALHRLVC